MVTKTINRELHLTTEQLFDQEIDQEDFDSLYIRLRELEIAETRALIESQPRTEEVKPAENWLMDADLSDPRYASMNLEKLHSIQEALQANKPLVLCETCGEIYPAVGYWYKCREENNFRHGHDKIVTRKSTSATMTTFFINQHTGRVWVPGVQGKEPRDRKGRLIPGYVLHEVRNYRERDATYKLLDSIAKTRYAARMEREERIFEPILHENRKQLRQDIKYLGKEVVEHAMRKTDDARYAKQRYEPNSMIEAYEFDDAHKEGGGLNPEPMLDKVQPKVKPLPSGKSTRALYQSRIRELTAKQRRRTA